MGSGGFATLAFARLFIMPMRADLSHDAFFVQFLLESAQRLVDRLAASDFDFGYSTFHSVNTCLSRFVAPRRDYFRRQRERKTSEWARRCQTEADTKSPNIRRTGEETNDLWADRSHTWPYDPGLSTTIGIVMPPVRLAGSTCLSSGQSIKLGYRSARLRPLRGISASSLPGKGWQRLVG